MIRTERAEQARAGRLFSPGRPVPALRILLIAPFKQTKGLFQAPGTMIDGRLDPVSSS